MTSLPRLSVVAALTAALAAYVSHCLNKYLSGKTGVTESVSPAVAFQFPAVAACGVVPDLAPAGHIRPWVRKVRHDVLTGEDGRGEYSLGKEEGSRVDWNKRGKITLFGNGTRGTGHRMEEAELFDVLSLGANDMRMFCQIYKPPKILTPYTAYYELLLDIEDEHRVPSEGVTQLYPVIVGHTNTLSLSLDMLGSAYILVPSKPTKKRNMKVRVKFGQYLSLSTSERPCLGDSEMKEKIEEEGEEMYLLSCTLRYLTARAPCYALGRGDENNRCSDQDLRVLGSAVRNLTAGGEHQYLRELGCLPPCLLPTYELEMTPGFDEEEAGEGEKGTAFVSLYAPSPKITLKREYLLYDLGSLAGDVGGMVGMLLGASALAFYDTACKFAKRVLRSRVKSDGGSSSVQT